MRYVLAISPRPRVVVLFIAPHFRNVKIRHSDMNSQIKFPLTRALIAFVLLGLRPKR
jgi:hypothetical protein